MLSAECYAKIVANGIKSFFLTGPAGRLEALLNQGQPDATHAALVCHPHPLFGGTMHNKVVYHAMKTLSGFGFPVLRFNFRGAGLSDGEHDRGHGEQEDVRAALNWLDSSFHLPMIFADFLLAQRRAFASPVTTSVLLGSSLWERRWALKVELIPISICRTALGQSSLSAARSTSMVRLRA